MQPPNDLVRRAFLEPTVEVSRRIEIYESDATTPWRPDLWKGVLIGGSVSVDMGRDERRSLDIELDNRTGELSPVAGGLWYDKVIKVFYGVSLGQDRTGGPRIHIIYPSDIITSTQPLALRSLLNRQGLSNVSMKPAPSRWFADMSSIYEIADQAFTGADLCICFLPPGDNEIYMVPLNTMVDMPTIIVPAGLEWPPAPGDGSAAAWLASVFGLEHGPLEVSIREFEREPGHELPIEGAFDSWVLASGEYRPIVSAQVNYGNVTTLASMTNGSPAGGMGALALSGLLTSTLVYLDQGGFDQAAFVSGRDACGGFIAALIRGMADSGHRPEWETQIGEFEIDSIQDTDSNGDIISLVGRDYAKRCLQSRLAKSTMFGKDEPIERVIRNLAVNSGITKIDLPNTGETLGKDMTWERDVERFSVMKEIALAKNFELYFSAEGYLTMRPQRDPLLTPATLDLTTGPGGNLISRGAKTSGGQLFNFVTVVGESSDTTAPLVYAEAVNDDPTSPTWIGLPGTPGGIGERTKNISSPLVTTSEQAQVLADTMLSVSMLEEFELNFSSVLLPWVEVGEILEMVDPESKYWGPSRYLLSTLSLPLDLSPMSGTGKRVTVIR